jgi:hypothetical protein
LANKNEIARLAKSLMKGLCKGKCALTEEMQREEDVKVVEYSDTKSETDLKYELAKAISISTAKPKSGQAHKIFSSIKKVMSLYEATWTLTPDLKMLFDALLTIQPTSTQNERNISIYVWNICHETKIKTIG